MRNPAKAEMLPPPVTLITSLDQLACGHPVIDAIVNLAGEPIGNGLWTEAKRRKILASRIDMTADVVKLIARLERKPAVLVSGSADRLVRALAGPGADRDRPSPTPASATNCCEAWENAARPPTSMACAWSCLRIGLVLGTDGGFITRMLTPFEFGLGGPLGSGRQWMSWIERDDLVRLIAHVIARLRIWQGRSTRRRRSRSPTRNSPRSWRRRLHRPAIFRMPGGAAARASAAILPMSCCWAASACCRTRRCSNGFVFRHETLRSAFEAIL